MLSNTHLHDHLGAMLYNEYFQPRKLTIYRVARDAGIAGAALCGVLGGKKRLPVREALLLARYFGVEEDLFARMQLSHEVRIEKEKMAAEKMGTDLFSTLWAPTQGGSS